MSYAFKKNVGISGKFKQIVTNGETFVDDETGEIIDLANVLYTVYGDTPFDVAISQKADSDVTPEGGDE